MEDLVDFVTAKTRRLAAFDRLLATIPALEAVGAPSMAEDGIPAEIDAARAGQFDSSGGADRS